MVHEPFRYSQVSAALPSSSQRVVTTSEAELQTELDVPRPASADDRVRRGHVRCRAGEGVASHGAELPELRRHDYRSALGKATKRLELAERCMREATRVAVSRVRKVKEGNPPTGRRLDVRGIAEDIPAIAELAGEADIVPVQEAVRNTPRGSALDSNNRVHLPTLEQLAPALPRRKIIGQRKCQAMADVEVAVPALQSGPVAVLRLRGTIERSKVDGVRPGIAQNVSETVPGSLRNRNLQAMVDGAIAILHKVDEPQERETRGEWPAGLLDRKS